MKDMMKPVLWSIISLVMLWLFAVPGLNVIALLLIFVPNTVLYTLVNRKVFAACIVVVWALASILLGPSVTVYFLIFIEIPTFILISISVIPSIILGELYKKKNPSTRTIPYVTAIVVLIFMVCLLLLETVFDLSLISQFKSIVKSQYVSLNEAQLLATTITPDLIDAVIDSMVKLIPLAITMMAFVVVICSHYVARRIVTKYGHPVLPFPKAKDWNLPRKIIFFYFVVYLLEFMIDRTSTDFLTIAVLNLVPAFSFAFQVQAMGFFFHIADHYKWPKILPILLVVPVLFIPLFSILGLIDVAFNLRNRITKK